MNDLMNLVKTECEQAMKYTEWFTKQKELTNDMVDTLEMYSALINNLRRIMEKCPS